MAKKREEEFVIDGEQVWPRTIKERYGLFRVKGGGRPDLIATCRTQSEVGTTLCRLGKEGEFLDYCIGVMDGRDHKNKDGEWIGKWLILPWLSKEAVTQLQSKSKAK
jgi:hypothetical protein